LSFRARCDEPEVCEQVVKDDREAIDQALLYN